MKRLALVLGMVFVAGGCASTSPTSGPVGRSAYDQSRFERFSQTPGGVDCARLSREEQEECFSQDE